jgi:hypothetical protein
MNEPLVVAELEFTADMAGALDDTVRNVRVITTIIKEIARIITLTW